jgi:Zn-dependent protease
MSAAVPLCYIAVGFAALIALLPVGGTGAGFLGLLLVHVGRATGVLAAFSMIPVPGFPGADIWRWSKAAFIALIVAAVALYWGALV